MPSQAITWLDGVAAILERKYEMCNSCCTITLQPALRDYNQKPVREVLLLASRLLPETQTRRGACLCTAACLEIS